jgi:hypothetical protein
VTAIVSIPIKFDCSADIVFPDSIELKIKPYETEDTILLNEYIDGSNNIKNDDQIHVIINNDNADDYYINLCLISKDNKKTKMDSVEGNSNIFTINGNTGNHLDISISGLNTNTCETTGMQYISDKSEFAYLRNIFELPSTESIFVFLLSFEIKHKFI